MISPAQVARRQLTLATHKIRELPVVVLMPHSRCNCRCVMCDIWKANANKQELSREDLEPHVETLRKWRTRWVVFSGGEALMHSNLWALCEMLRELGVKITLLSTGLLLARDADDILRWCDEVIVSLDGSREVHDEIRRIPRGFEKLAAGVAALKERSPDFRVTGRSVIQRLNFRDFPNILQAAKDLGLDEISFLAADVSSEAFNRPDPWDADRVEDVAPSPEEAKELVEILERTLAERAEDFRSGFVAESPEKIRDIGRRYLAHHGLGPEPEVFCNAPWVSTVVEADGTVRPCFFHDSFGNIRDQPLDQILNSPEAIAFRRSLDIATDPICQKCVCTLRISPREKL